MKKVLILSSMWLLSACVNLSAVDPIVNGAKDVIANPQQLNPVIQTATDVADVAEIASGNGALIVPTNGISAVVQSVNTAKSNVVKPTSGK